MVLESLFHTNKQHMGTLAAGQVRYQIRTYSYVTILARTITLRQWTPQNHNSQKTCTGGTILKCGTNQRENLFPSFHTTLVFQTILPYRLELRQWLWWNYTLSQAAYVCQLFISNPCLFLCFSVSSKLHLKGHWPSLFLFPMPTNVEQISFFVYFVFYLLFVWWT